ncbi:hypothetical protein FOCG_11994 [Fusarium oxysporum f. sp. radicis-lycopersici 26381]|uniref:Hydrophobin n=4 Tax=Fusarium oxysporum TaxID=5507 RepID=A0A420NXI5_FUSOX|nr:hydrophobin [Fusarium oxysporum Fo47]EWZ89353.1 hypothetical protein FOWG_09056 [Fusarium oxysporum f. sp. lycopersici MN25]EXL46003.1 hypothetical protein FOCG_11994 [Fusarium oxysporum f. sp. radicis-lycopersici 26381]KAF5242711.1 hypothetical protein FOXYS1_15346 [Fusarium oxysporum]KAH7493600.1 hypothetical protein FOMA001_g147 [Fusarium oxysporum f. sp. matthiolae]RKK28111.1 hypothetical protein BFJ65_g64 [Fusarium oxysporum f. sp. cepae]RYC87389.1 hypothetical protein BFJ63_vAg9698 [
MQFSILALLVAATGALAAPGNRGGDRGDRGGNRGDRNTNTQTVTCTGGSAYCCSPEYGEGGLFSYYECSKNTNSCNVQSTIVCCAQNVQGNNNHQSQKCSAFGDQKVIYV